MIKYALKCPGGHAFESWFASAAAYDALEAAGRLTCAICGGSGVEKALMAPRLRSTDADAEGAGAPSERTSERRLARPASPAEAALTELRQRIEANTEDVGRRFAAEARAIHDGSAPERAIRGQADAAEARALVEEGVPILPLPFPPERQVN